MTALPTHDREPITEEKLLKAVNILADLVERNGPAFRPLYLSLRQQLSDLRLQQGAEAALEAIAARGGTKVA
ncbi:hypothetical protein [Microvirga lotononidis]|uniref:Uncharacterized protein n=1 Tax=Microvirga lotononidis TaxID=864069 RepID=I4Z2B5_9HYPH|nr:hypothetical protein [Microvirga lotononidis]EIM30357.1 hypothetical protein MicloDRAFT_00009070 [Microvirga lotononidis]WQO30855.1 hypothetical protein U0023_25940 [Microvirga lotononidis]